MAKLRAHKADSNPTYLRSMLPAADGSSSRYDQLRETAFKYAFILDALGLAAAASTNGGA